MWNRLPRQSSVRSAIVRGADVEDQRSLGRRQLGDRQQLLGARRDHQQARAAGQDRRCRRDDIALRRHDLGVEPVVVAEKARRWSGCPRARAARPRRPRRGSPADRAARAAAAARRPGRDRRSRRRSGQPRQAAPRASRPAAPQRRASAVAPEPIVPPPMVRCPRIYRAAPGSSTGRGPAGGGFSGFSLAPHLAFILSPRHQRSHRPDVAASRPCFSRCRTLSPPAPLCGSLPAFRPTINCSRRHAGEAGIAESGLQIFRHCRPSPGASAI